MDCFGEKRKSKRSEKQLITGLSGEVRILEEEIKAIMCEREKESRVYERDGVVFALKESEWEREKKKLKEEVKKLRKMLDEKMVEDKNFSFSSSLLVEQMKEERLWRDEAVQKWKKLYLAIKIELDNLIQRTYSGDGLYCKAEEEEMIEQLKMELKSKDKTIEDLKEKLSGAEHEEYKKAREVDILRQSLRIMTSRKVPSFPLTNSNFAFVKQPKKI